jgi:hypothetical protein
MIARYGHIPDTSTIDGSSAQRLGLFLNDFVLNFGLLRKRDENMMDTEQGNINGFSYERNSSDDGMDAQSSGQRSEVPPGESNDYVPMTELYDGDTQSSLPLARWHARTAEAERVTADSDILESSNL